MASRIFCFLPLFPGVYLETSVNWRSQTDQDNVETPSLRVIDSLQNQEQRSIPIFTSRRTGNQNDGQNSSLREITSEVDEVLQAFSKLDEKLMVGIRKLESEEVESDVVHIECR